MTKQWRKQNFLQNLLENYRGKGQLGEKKPEKVLFLLYRGKKEEHITVSKLLSTAFLLAPALIK